MERSYWQGGDRQRKFWVCVYCEKKWWRVSRCEETSPTTWARNTFILKGSSNPEIAAPQKYRRNESCLWKSSCYDARVSVFWFCAIRSGRSGKLSARLFRLHVCQGRNGIIFRLFTQQDRRGHSSQFTIYSICFVLVSFWFRFVLVSFRFVSQTTVSP